MEYTGIVEILPVAFQETGITGIKFPSNSAGRLAYKTENHLMTFAWATSFFNQVSAVWKRDLSFLKRDWELSDYPIRVRAQEVGPAIESSRFKQARYVASIVNWWVLDGTGDTREEAIRNLKIRFEDEKVRRKEQGKALPRPGTHVPIEFATQERVSRHAELSEDFIRRVLGLGSAWISDESSLWHFHTDETNDQLFAKIKVIYGVDVSDITSGNLSEIFDRIAASRLRT